MDLSNFVTYDKKESLLLSIAKSNLDIAENTLSKPQETLKFKMNKQKESFPFDIPLDLPEQWMMGVTSLEVYNTVYNITEKNNKFKLLYTEKMLKEINVDTQLVPNVEYLYKTSGDIEKIKKLIVNDNAEIKTITKTDYDYLMKIIDQINQNTEGALHIKDKPIVISGIGSVTDSIEIELPPGAYELVDINNAIQQKLIDCCTFKPGDSPTFKLNIEADTISMKSVLTTASGIYFNSELNKLLGFTNKEYLAGTHISEKPVMITTTDKVHLKCDCVDGSIVNGIREQILFSFNLSAPPGYKIIKEPNIILYKKINKTRLDSIQFFLEDNNHNPVDFNSETLTFTIQIIKI